MRKTREKEKFLKKEAEKADKKLKGRNYKKEQDNDNNKTHIHRKIKRKARGI